MFTGLKTTRARTLSYSQERIIAALLAEMDSQVAQNPTSPASENQTAQNQPKPREATVTMTRLADNIGISRGVASTAVGKANAAGWLRSWSMGRDGTRVQIRNRGALEAAARH